MALVKKLKHIAGIRNKETGEVTFPNQKVYIVFLYNNDETQTFEKFYTREETFEYCVDNVTVANIAKSQVMTNKQTPEDTISVYSFIRMIYENMPDLAIKVNMDIDEITEYAIQDGTDPEVLYKEDMEG